jgi:glycosyltransferase involved in cell wall biosynthesis
MKRPGDRHTGPQRAADPRAERTHAARLPRGDFAFPTQITIADNASDDGTLDAARMLADELEGVEVLYLDRKGRGHALRVAWTRSDADVLAYMDVDLSTDLSALGELVVPLLAGRGDIAIGSRLSDGAQVTRGLKREVISRCYNVLLHVLLGAGFSDAQCGFKAGRREAIQALLDDIQDEAWFFDTELLYLAQRRKLAIREVPVRWIEDPDSRVDIISTARDDLRGIMRLRAAERGRHPRPSAQPAANRAVSSDPPVASPAL